MNLLLKRAEQHLLTGSLLYYIRDELDEPDELASLGKGAGGARLELLFLSFHYRSSSKKANSSH